jgi:hypothetical protein
MFLLRACHMSNGTGLRSQAHRQAADTMDILTAGVKETDGSCIIVLTRNARLTAVRGPCSARSALNTNCETTRIENKNFELKPNRLVTA